MLDTNVWLSTDLLNSAHGAALRNVVARGDGAIVLPEVVRLELLSKAVGKWVDAAHKVQSNLETIAAIKGAGEQVRDTPSETEMRVTIEHSADIGRPREKIA